MSDESVTVDFDFDDLEANFKSAKIEDRSNNEPPSGKYTVKVDKAAFDYSAKKHKMFKVQFEIASGKHKRRKLFWNTMLSGDKGPSDIGIKIVKNFFALAGIKDDSFKVLGSKVGQLLDLYFEVNKAAQKTDPTRYNIYVNAKAEKPDDADEPVAAGSNSGEEVPF